MTAVIVKNNTKSYTSNTLAAALEIMSGHPFTSVCVHCLHEVDPHEDVPARRASGGGWCVRCPAIYDAGERSEVFVLAMSTANACAINVREAA